MVTDLERRGVVAALRVQRNAAAFVLICAVVLFVIGGPVIGGAVTCMYIGTLVGSWTATLRRLERGRRQRVDLGGN